MLAIKSLRQRGDTIVEVIVVLAVLGLAVSISYATANRSLLATRQAEESSQATALLQSQLETLQAYSGITGDSPHDIFQTTGFCINAAGDVVPNLNIARTLPVSDTSVYSKYDAACQANQPFHITLGYEAVDSDGNPTDTFTAKATWDDVAGAGKDTVTLVSRVHK
jgi:prepilin-type N-terminal cleavage/methylation domain-containing protein